MNAVEELGELFIKGVIKGLGSIDPSDFGTKIASGLGHVWTGLSNEITGESFGKKIAEVMQKVITEMRMGETGGLFGGEFADGIRQFAYPAAAAVGDGVAYLAQNIILKTFPYAVIAAVGAVGVPLTLFFIYYTAKHNIGKPALAIEYRKKTLFTPFFKSKIVQKINNFFFGAKESKRAPIFNETLQKQIDDIRNGLNCLQKNKGDLQNILLYGPPGTGKTMIAEKFLEDLDMDYIKMSGGDLAQYIGRGEHVTELNKLMLAAKASTRPTILFIDEAESLAKKRGDLKSEHVELLNAFLTHTGTASKNLVIIMATNRLEDIDEAVVSRMDYKIAIHPPGETERVNMIKSYAIQFFGSSDAEAHFTNKKIAKIAKSTEGFTGRDISKVMNRILGKKGSTENNSLTAALIDEEVENYVKQEKATREK